MNKRHERAFVIFLAFIINAFWLLSFFNPYVKITKFEILLFAAVSNVFVAILYYVSSYFKKFGIENNKPIDLALDLSAKKKGYAMMNCPHCGKRTISWTHSMKMAQTCGECGRKFKGIISRKIYVGLHVFMFFMLFIATYFGYFKSADKMMVTILYLTGLMPITYYISKPKKLEEVYII